MKKVSVITSCIYNENTGWYDVTTEDGRTYQNGAPAQVGGSSIDLHPETAPVNPNKRKPTASEIVSCRYDAGSGYYITKTADGKVTRGGAPSKIGGSVITINHD